MTRPSNIGERLSGLEATVTSLEKYEHDRWHKLAQDLQPLVLLPERLTREMGRLQGTFDGRIVTISKEIERSITSAVEKAIEPINTDVADLKVKVATLLEERSRRDGASGIVQSILKSPLLAWLAMISAAAWAVLSGRVQP